MIDSIINFTADRASKIERIDGGEHLEENDRATGPANNRVVSQNISTVLQGAAPGLVIRRKRDIAGADPHKRRRVGF